MLEKSFAFIVFLCSLINLSVRVYLSRKMRQPLNFTGSNPTLVLPMKISQNDQFNRVKRIANLSLYIIYSIFSIIAIIQIVKYIMPK